MHSTSSASLDISALADVSIRTDASFNGGSLADELAALGGGGLFLADEMSGAGSGGSALDDVGISTQLLAMPMEMDAAPQLKQSAAQGQVSAIINDKIIINHEKGHMSATKGGDVTQEQINEKKNVQLDCDAPQTVQEAQLTICEVTTSAPTATTKSSVPARSPVTATTKKQSFILASSPINQNVSTLSNSATVTAARSPLSSIHITNAASTHARIWSAAKAKHQHSSPDEELSRLTRTAHRTKRSQFKTPNANANASPASPFVGTPGLRKTGIRLYGSTSTLIISM